MTLCDAVRKARENNDWDCLIRAIPFSVFLRLRMEVHGDSLTCILPAQERLVGNPWLPALHGGATAGFMECAAILFLLWHRDSVAMPKTVDFTIDYLRSGKVQDTYATMQMVKLGARMANIRVTAYQANLDKPIAVGHGNFLLTP
ncbi:MAG: PaaI family thioesterase [Betaproteobacteria bacterium]|nr:PaaI family thioesterase [Betaproteobacteria bacterium]